MSSQELDNLIRERNSLRIELTRERIISEYRHKGFLAMWTSAGKNHKTFSEWFWHHTYFETYMRSVPAFAIDTEPFADYSAHWDHYLLFVESWMNNGGEHTFSEYLEVLNQRYDMMEQD